MSRPYYQYAVKQANPVEGEKSPLQREWDFYNPTQSGLGNYAIFGGLGALGGAGIGALGAGLLGKKKRMGALMGALAGLGLGSYYKYKNDAALAPWMQDIADRRAELNAHRADWGKEMDELAKNPFRQNMAIGRAKGDFLPKVQGLIPNFLLPESMESKDYDAAATAALVRDNQLNAALQRAENRNLEDIRGGNRDAILEAEWKNTPIVRRIERPAGT